MGGWKNIVEPGAIVLVFTIGTLINRRKNTKLLRILRDDESPLLRDDRQRYKARGSDGNSEVPRLNIQSRILAYFPFLLEIWYWLLTYWIYQGLRAVSARAISDNKAVFDRAQHHAIQILSFEHSLHINIELSVQRLVLDSMPWLMNIFAYIYYSHIVLGIIFLVYCYTTFQRGQYQSIRRALALQNAIAFVVFTVWRCTPPRLLPEEYGFIDVLHKDQAGSSWTQNKFQLTIAAMPSLHFANSMFIGFCLTKFSIHWPLRFIAPLWPVLMGTTILATANHYVLDAIVGACVIATAYRFNRLVLVLLPVENVLFKVLRVEKPDDREEKSEIDSQ